MVREFTRIVDIYSSPDKSGNQKLIKKGVLQRITLDTDEMQVEEYVNSKGKPIKNKCTIKVKGDFYILAHPYEEVKKLVTNIKVEGFKYKNKR